MGAALPFPITIALGTAPVSPMRGLAAASTRKTMPTALIAFFFRPVSGTPGGVEVWAVGWASCMVVSSWQGPTESNGPGLTFDVGAGGPVATNLSGPNENRPWTWSVSLG